MKEHRDACMRGFTDRSVMTEHAWTQDHPISWNEAGVLDHTTRATKLDLKEVLCIQTTLEGERLTQDEDYKMLDCWIATVKKQGELELAEAMPILKSSVLSSECVAIRKFMF